MSAYFKYLMRVFYFRALLTVYAFFVFFGVMPKAPPRGRFQSPFEHMFLTVSNSLGGFVALAALLLVILAAWAGIAAAAGRKPGAVPAEADATLKKE